MTKLLKIMRFKNLIIIISAALISSCSSAPVARTAVTHPPLADMQGVKSIMVTPFEPSGNLNLAQQVGGRLLFGNHAVNEEQYRHNMAKFFTNNLASYIKNSELYKSIPYSDDKQGTDAYISGEVTKFSFSKSKQNKNSSSNEAGSVEMTVYYFIKRVSDSKVLWVQTIIDSYEVAGKMTSLDAEKLAGIILTKMVRAITPYQTIKQYNLEKDKSGDSNMKVADELVKNNMYDKALSRYQSVYEKTGNEVAGYDAALLLDATGNTSGAIDAMNALLNKATDFNLQKKIIQQLSRMNEDIKEQELMRSYSQQ